MGGTPSTIHESVLDEAGWGLSDATFTPSSDTYAPATGGLRGAITALMTATVGSNPYSVHSAYNPTSSGEPFATKPSSVASALAAYEAYVESLAEGTDRWESGFDSVDGKVDVSTTSLVPTHSWSFTVASLAAYTPAAAPTYAGAAIGSYAAPTLTASIAEIVGTTDFEIDTDVERFIEMSVDVDDAVTQFTNKSEARLLENISKLNAMMSDMNFASSTSRGIGIALLERDWERSIDDYQAQLELQLAIKRQELAVQYADIKYRFEQLKMQQTLSVEELKLRREELLKEYVALQLRGQEVRAQWEALKLEPEKYKLGYAELVHKPEELTLKYNELLNQREQIKVAREQLWLNNEEMKLKAYQAKVGADVEIARIILGAAANVVEAGNQNTAARASLMEAVRGINTDYMSAVRQNMNDTLQLDIENALWDAKLYEMFIKNTAALSGASIVPRQPSPILEAISSVSGIASAIVPLLGML